MFRLTLAVSLFIYVCMLGQIYRKYAKRVPKHLLAKAANFWGPFLGAGIKIDRISEDFLEIDISMQLSWYNSNYVGTHYGGSIYSMVDPFYMLIMMESLGSEYLVWDKAAHIKFIKPGTEKLFAKFSMSKEEIAEIKDEVEKMGKLDITKKIQITNKSGQLIADVDKTIYIALKNAESKR